IPASSTSISSPNRSKVQFIPNSPIPPRGMISITLATIYDSFWTGREVYHAKRGTRVPPVGRRDDIFWTRSALRVILCAHRAFRDSDLHERNLTMAGDPGLSNDTCI